MSELAFIEAFKAREDLAIYGDNALILFALEMRFEVEDIHAVAERSLTDGNDDKKCDLVYVDRDNSYALVAQGYFSQTYRSSAPANKASDLNTAASWLLTMELSELPEIIRYAASELRDAISAGEINTLEFWYNHNLPESSNVQSELKAVERAAQNAIKTYFEDSNCSEIRSIEVGSNTLQAWYKALRNPILVDQAFEINIPGGYALKSSNWRAYQTAVPATWFYEAYRDLGEDLFSANPRGYLGSRRSDANINSGIKRSARESPDNFWAFNNGITALVNKFRIIRGSKQRIRIEGISIVNGAQTTGAIGSLPKAPHLEAMVPTRFIECSSPKIVQQIIEFNNSQNKMVPADFRSGDPVQKRLREEFKKYPTLIAYTGGRRGGAGDIIRRNPNLLPSDTVAQALAAFHGRPRDAYNSKSQLWRSEQRYGEIFNDHTTAEHIIFAYSLQQVISKTKRDLMSKSRNGEILTEDENNTLKFLRMRGALFLLVAALGDCIETILDKPIPSRFSLRFKNRPCLSSCETNWLSIIDSMFAFCEVLRPPLENSLRSNDEINTAISEFKMRVRATRKPLKAVYESFAHHVTI
jgi:hypothetical protein